MKRRLNMKFHTTGRFVLLSLLFSLLLGSFAVTLPTQAAPLTQGVQRIRFAPGATSAVVNGNLASGQVGRYVLTALAGQMMTIQPYSDGSPVIVSILDPSRTVIGSAASGESWSGRLPATGDYALAVYPSPYVANTNFQLRVEIVNNSPPPTPTPAPERIRFAPGAISAQITGFLPTSEHKVYVLGARAGQVMTIQSWTSSGPFRFIIRDKNGTWLGSGDGGEWWSGTIPRSEDYWITLQSPVQVQGANYGLLITIVDPAATPTPTPTPTAAPPASAERVRFPQGATSVTLTGYVDSFSPARYVLRALRGQTMTLSLGTLYGNATSVTVRDARGNFLGGLNVGEEWTGYLPSTGDYFVEVQAPRENPGDHFSLWLEIR